MKPVEYIEVTAEDGTAYATSTFDDYAKYKPEKAFKIFGASQYTYWCSTQYPKKTVYIWFQFKTPQYVTKIKFLEQYPLPTTKIYQVKEKKMFH